MYGTDKKGDLGTGTWWEGIVPNLERRFENNRERVREDAAAWIYVGDAVQGVLRDEVEEGGAGCEAGDGDGGAATCRVGLS